MTPSYERVVVVGASAGGVSALIQIAEALPAAFPAPVCMVLHIGANPSLLPQLLQFRGANPAVHPEDGQSLAPGMLHIAPPDHHMLLDGDRLRLLRGPKENHARPAIDPLFRSAALHFGPRVIGVVLTGQMDDGSAGLKAIQDCGGTVIVQDPATATEPEMPSAALRHVTPDHCVPLADIAPLLARLVGTPAPVTVARPPEEVVREVAINLGANNVENLQHIASPSTLTCPDCGGSLWEMKSARPLRYRCHTGHAYSAVSLARAQQESAELAVRSSVRALREREILLRRTAEIATAIGDQAQAAAGTAHADLLAEQVRTLQRVAEALPLTPMLDDAA